MPSNEGFVGAIAADFPKDPWNCVCLEPHPTFIGASVPNSDLSIGDSESTSKVDVINMSLSSPVFVVSSSWIVTRNRAYG